ncbi:MAG: LuxR C-terminal-related transcriptional regulator [Treponema sp.]|jgi:LuxR family maltose regulon positive regulatory protein|nr:LuxR C-terminal-related transcriptional regulator [Treponema sp.]
MKKTIYSLEAPGIPPGAFFLERPRIHKLLEKALQNPVVTINAGEGYGKTWAAYSFLRNSDSVNAWIRVSEQDNKAEHLWEKKNNTVGLCNPELGSGLLDIGFPDTNERFDKHYRLIEKKIKPEKKYILVYDDFHLIRDPRILDFLNQYLVSPFPNISTILIYRKEPDINNVSLLSKGFLARISEEDLRFNREETVRYFKEQHIPMTEENLNHVYHSTEGWPLLLSLIAREALDKKPGEWAYSPELLKRKSEKLIEDRFFSSLHGEMRKFLIKISLMERRPRELFERLASRELVADMEKISPIIRYDSYRHGYRIPKILIEFLREKQGELSPEEIRQFYGSAAEWYAENGLRTEAALCYDRAGDYRGIFNMINSFPGLMPGEIAAFFMGLIGTHLDENSGVDDEYLALLRYTVRPKLIFALGRLEEAAAECRRIIQQFESLPPNALNAKILVMNYTCLGSILIFSCRFTRNYNFFPVFKKALYHYEKYPFHPEEALTKCGLPSYICQIAYPAEKELFESSIGKLASIEPYASRVLNGYLSGAGFLAWAELYYFKGDIGAAEKNARQAVFQARENRQYETENRGLFFLLRISIHSGDQGEIENIFRQLENQLEKTDYFSRFIFYDIVSGWFYAQTGNTSRIAPWLRNNFEKSELSDLFRPFETLVKAKCAYAEKRYNAVLQILETQNDPRGLESFYLGKLEVLLLKAATRYHLGSVRAALADLGEACKIAFPCSFSMPFTELGETMYLLAGAALSSEKNSISSEWLEKTRNRASAYGKKLNILAESLRQPGKEVLEQGLAENPPVPVLRRREEMVLQALSQGFTREEIVRKEQISLNAVKENIKNLYDKLGALNRADAIRIANSMGLLRKFEKSSH